VRTGAFADSERVWADAVEKVPESALGWTQRAMAANERREAGYAEVWARRAIEAPGRAEVKVKARLARADALLLLGRTAELLDEANAAATLAASLPERDFVRAHASEALSQAEVRRGQALEALGDAPAAREAYRRAVEWKAGSFEAQFDYGTSLAAAGRVPEALRHLRAALDLKPEYVDAHVQLAKVLAADGQEAEAARVLERATSRFRRQPEVVLARVDLLLAKGDVERALVELRALLLDAPNHPRAVERLSALWIDVGQRLLTAGRQDREVKLLREARERFDEALRVHPGRWEAEVGAGDALLELGAFRQARDRYRKARALATERAWIDGLAARAGVLDAAWAARASPGGPDDREPGRRMAEAVRLPVERIDLGFVPLESELGLLREMADRLDAGREPEASFAASLLAAAALLAAGDDEAAQARVRAVTGTLPGDDSYGTVLDAGLLLQALIRDRRGDVERAREDYRLLVERRPSDSGPALRLQQVSLRIALARLETARGYGDDPQRVLRAEREVEETCEGLTRFADANPGDAGAGLLAAESDMRRARWVEALRRLNALAERFPTNPSVFRGQSAVYVSRYMSNRDPTLLEEALGALDKAMALDPRDARTALDAAGVRRIAGDLRGALRLASRARALESVPGGPAARTLAALHLAIGRQALEQGNLEAARKAIQASRRADPGSAASWVLEGELFLDREKELNKALEAGKRAKELEPLSAEADAFLSRVHYQRGLKARLWAAALREPEPPRANAKAWEALDEAARAEAVAKHETAVASIRRQKTDLARIAEEEFEASLRLDPDAEHAPEARAHLEASKRNDPEARRRRALEAQEAWLRGQALLEEGKKVAALEAFREAARSDPEHRRAHFRIVTTAYELMTALAGVVEEQALVHRYVNVAFESLQALDGLDVADEFPLRHLYRGLVNESIYRRAGSEEARLSAIRAYGRFLASPLVLEKKDDENAALARRRLEALRKEER
jgi:tetratricopeptide (TPR) repeat protein